MDDSFISMPLFLSPIPVHFQHSFCILPDTSIGITEIGWTNESERVIPNLYTYLYY
jgi:hypothetical protein